MFAFPHEGFCEGQSNFTGCKLGYFRNWEVKLIRGSL